MARGIRELAHSMSKEEFERKQRNLKRFRLGCSGRNPFGGDYARQIERDYPGWDFSAHELGEIDLRRILREVREAGGDVCFIHTPDQDGVPRKILVVSQKLMREISNHNGHEIFGELFSESHHFLAPRRSNCVYWRLIYDTNQMEIVIPSVLKYRREVKQPKPKYRVTVELL